MQRLIPSRRKNRNGSRVSALPNHAAAPEHCKNAHSTSGKNSDGTSTPRQSSIPAEIPDFTASPQANTAAKPIKNTAAAISARAAVFAAVGDAFADRSAFDTAALFADMLADGALICFFDEKAFCEKAFCEKAVTSTARRSSFIPPISR